MPYVLSYTKPGIGEYDNSNYPRLHGLKCDVEHAMHLAVSDDGRSFKPMRNNTGILYPKCTYTEGPWTGTTKTLLYPWIFRSFDGFFMVSAVRRNQNAPDPLSVGCMMLFTSKDLVRYEEAGFLKLADGEIKNPRCRWNADRGAYYVEWETEDGLLCGYTKYFNEICDIEPCDTPLFSAAPDYGVPEAVPGNVIEITEAEAKVIRRHFDEITNVGMIPPEPLEVTAGDRPDFRSFPKVTFTYSDGSTHDKTVRWDFNAYRAIDFSKPGEYEIPGEILQKKFPFPQPLSCPPGMDPEKYKGNISDPDAFFYKDYYYFLSSCPEGLYLRRARKFEDCFTAESVLIYETPKRGLQYWAPELHFIDGVPYIFTGICPGPWYTVCSHVLRCTGNIMDINAWEEPRPVVRPNGKLLHTTDEGISLDMTYMNVNGVHYILWSDRKHHLYDGRFIERVSPEPADIYIAIVDPKAPWQCVSEPVCILRALYGWERCETEVDEGPYLLRHGDDLFITVSGSSTGFSDLYLLGFLKAKAGDNLLDIANWDWIPYPFLTKESFPNQWGPGHNTFVVDHETGDDMMVYHAVPHDENGKSLWRKCGVRRVHWAATGLPYLEMSEERDVKPEFRKVTLKISVK